MSDLESDSIAALGFADESVRFQGAIERLIYLRGLPGLRHVRGNDLRIMAQHASGRTFAAGEHLLRQGEPPTAMYFIVEGRVDVSLDGIVHQTCTAPGGVGFLPLLANNPKSVDAVAVVDTTTLAIPGAEFLELMATNFNFVASALRELSGQLASTQRELELRGLWQRGEAEVGPYPEEALDLVQRLGRVRRGPYVDVSLEALMELSRLAVEVRFEPGEVLWREGDPAASGLWLLHGIVRCTSDDGRRVFRLGCDSVLGMMEAHAGRPRSYEAVTETRVVALESTSETYLDVLEDHQEVGGAFVSFMANAITELKVRAARADRTPAGGADGGQGLEQRSPVHEATR